MSRHSPPRILMVEPETYKAFNLERELSSFGYRVSTLVTTIQELEAISSLEFDIMLTDVRLEGGVDILDRVSSMAKQRGIPFVFMVEALSEELFSRMIAASPNSIILKPFKGRELYIATNLALAARDDAWATPYGLEPGREGILIIEDEKIIALDVQRRLERFGYNVVGIAESAEDGIRLALRLRPALIMTGIILMGPMDGIEGTQIIKNHLDIPIVYLTALADDATLERAAWTRPEAYIPKPFKQGDLHASIELALSRFRDKVQPPDPMGVFAMARRGAEAEMAEALAKGGNPNERDAGGKTPLMYAALRSGNAGVVRVLVEAGAEIEACDIGGRTALMHAMHNGEICMAKALIESGASPSPFDKEGLSALDHELNDKPRSEMLGLLFEAGLDPNSSRPSGGSLLGDILSRNRGLPVAQVCLFADSIIAAGAKVNLTSLTALGPDGLAILADLSPDHLTSLCAEGLGLELADGSGWTALHFAARWGLIKGIDNLHAAGAELNAQDSMGRTPLMVTLDAWHIDAAQRLLDIGASPASSDAAGNSVLRHAVDSMRGHHTDEQGPVIIRTLVQAGGDADVADASSVTPLMAAIDQGASTMVVRALLDSGASLAPKDAKGQDALMHACLNEDNETIEILRRWGTPIPTVAADDLGTLVHFRNNTEEADSSDIAMFSKYFDMLDNRPDIASPTAIRIYKYICMSYSKRYYRWDPAEPRYDYLKLKVDDSSKMGISEEDFRSCIKLLIKEGLLRADPQGEPNVVGINFSPDILIGSSHQ